MRDRRDAIFGADGHQQLTENIAAYAATFGAGANTPVLVVPLGSLDENRIAGGVKSPGKVGAASEFHAEQVKHDFVLFPLPVTAHRYLATKPLSLAWGLCVGDANLLRNVRCLRRLKSGLAGVVRDAVNQKVNGVKIAEKLELTGEARNQFLHYVQLLYRLSSASSQYRGRHCT